MASIHKGIQTAVQTRIRALITGGTYLQELDSDSVRCRKVPSLVGFSSEPSAGEYSWPACVIFRMGREYPALTNETNDTGWHIGIALANADNRSVEEDDDDYLPEYIEVIENEFIDQELTVVSPSFTCYCANPIQSPAFSWPKWLENLSAVGTILRFDYEKATGN